MKLYRYEDVRYSPRVKIVERVFDVVKETPCGYWILSCGEFYSLSDYSSQKWVSSKARKRYAYPTRREAMVNFKARKHRQIQIVEAQLKQAKDALQYSDIDFPEFKDIQIIQESFWEGWGEIK